MSHSALPLIEELTPTPDTWDVFSRLAALPHVAFFDSVTRHPALGRYSFVAADPFEWIWSRGKETHVQSDAVTHREADPFSILAAYIARFPEDSVDRLPPFQGGAVGLFGFVLSHHLQFLPPPRLGLLPRPGL